MSIIQFFANLLPSKGSLLFDVSQNRGELSTKLTEGYLSNVWSVTTLPSAIRLPPPLTQGRQFGSLLFGFAEIEGSCRVYARLRGIFLISTF